MDDEWDGSVGHRHCNCTVAVFRSPDRDKGLGAVKVLQPGAQLSEGFPEPWRFETHRDGVVDKVRDPSLHHASVVARSDELSVPCEVLALSAPPTPGLKKRHLHPFLEGLLREDP